MKETIVWVRKEEDKKNEKKELSEREEMKTWKR